MMPKSRMTQVAEHLLQQSRAGKVAWEMAEIRESAYKVAFPDTTLVISRWSPLRDSSWATMRDLSRTCSVDVAVYRLELLNEANEVLETLLGIPGQIAYRTLRDTFALARGQVTHAEENIDKVLEYLRET
jgi:hypothetical protein